MSVDREITVATAAIRALGDIGYADPIIIQVLRRNLRLMSHPVKKLTSVVALGLLGEGAVATVPDLVKILRERTRAHRNGDRDQDPLLIETTKALGRIGGGARSGLPILCEVATKSDLDSFPRVMAIEAIAAIGIRTNLVAASLEGLTKDGHPRVRWAAKTALTRLRGNQKKNVHPD